MAKKRGRRGGGRRGLRGVSTALLHRELEKRRGLAGELLAEREELAARLAMIDDELAALEVRVDGGKPGRRRGRPPGSKAGRRGGGGRRRPRNDGNLVDALSSVLKGKTMSVTDAAAAALASGYRSNSKNFRTIVNQALIKSNAFKKVSRGQYTLRD